MVRNVIGSLIALAGAAAAVWSPFRDWYDGRLGRDYRIQDLFGGITAAEGALVTSLLLPFVFAALLAVVGVALRLRVPVALAGLVVLGFTVLWMVRQGQAAGSLTVGGDGGGLGEGVALAAGGGVLLLLGALVMSGRRRHVPVEEAAPPPPEEDWGPYGTDPTGPVPYRRGPYALRPDDTLPGAPPVYRPPPYAAPPQGAPPAGPQRWSDAGRGGEAGPEPGGPPPHGGSGRADEG
ncbi:hypothetical protein NPS70_11530 [Streptomyces sp. C10-9-1]|uniref:hypothetical protein n=1 Tax=Streptomyces sp. C10-9-1 TaxID=1859285 RepID=UPI0021115263|nr:hypothetical protein [Streptomyces sp. C10-9-1]MCQ6553821.1 hypothetical protein [Streptomyces sp. C10-9-1]